MNATTHPIVLTPHVINTINALPVDDRIAIAGALCGEMILGADASTCLTPRQNLMFAMIRRYVERDSLPREA